MPHLPDELWLHILSYLPPQDIWLSAHTVNQQLARCCEEFMTKNGILEKFTVGLQFSLGSGAHHRWYDVRGTITFSFQSLHRHNPQYGEFGACLVHPHACFDRAMERWKRMSAEGLGAQNDWRVQYGYEGQLRVVKLPSLVVKDGDGVWCDWKEMFDAYFGAANR